MPLTLQEKEGITIIHIDEKFVDAMNAPAIKADIQTVLKPKMQAIIDLSDVEFLDSSGMGAILAAMRQLISMGGHLKIAGVNKPVRTLLELVRFNKILDIFDSVDSAIQSFHTKHTS